MAELEVLLCYRHNLTEATKDLVKSSTDDVMQLAAYDLSGQVRNAILSECGRQSLLET